MTGSVCFAMLALRLVARRYSGNKLWLDDLFQILGAVSRVILKHHTSAAYVNVTLVDCDDPSSCDRNHG